MKQRLKSLRFRMLLPVVAMTLFVVILLTAVFSRAYIAMILQQEKEYTLTMEPGDKIFVYTDGVPEAIDKNDEMFGVERMVEALNTNADGRPEEILRSIRSAVDDFVGDAEKFDDITMMCIEYCGSESPSL
ncbi:MAG: serine/threonine-protein phosphatase, partial [Lachnospiraceae bacterium]|nr:serine/threonine-protein phosphatase [Lachnospiraceae bacterium]